MSAEGLATALEKMRADGVSATAIDVFTYYYGQLERGATDLIAEGDIEPLPTPPRLDDLQVDEDAARSALDSTVMIRLNGGLGTSMGMDRAKSLLPVKGGNTFLDVIVGQVRAARHRFGVGLPLLLMNSFRTRDDTLMALADATDLPVHGLPLDFLQSQEPKLRIDDLTPIEWAPDPSLEWCPPGHGDLYPALRESGVLPSLLDAGFRQALVANADNLGATVDARMAGWFATSGAPFASEVCRRTSADRKGGHLAIRRSDGQLLLRESAQTAPEDDDAFADVERHRYFNTNNLWMDLQALADLLDRRHGVLRLPLIRNEKTVDPSEPDSPRVVQIETAMGAAVEVFPGAAAVEVDRGRFLPVKTTNDLLVLRSDAYVLDDDFTISLYGDRRDAPLVELDADHYKLVDDFDARFPDGAPSLKDAESLQVEGDWTFEQGVVVTGTVEVGPDGSPGRIAAGSHLAGR